MPDFTLLHRAAWCGQTQLCIFLVALGHKHRPGYGGVTPLQLATMCGHYDTCKALIEHVDMDFLEQRPDGATAIEDAVINNRLDILVLMQDMFHVHEEIHARLLQAAIRRGYTECIEILVRSGSVNGTSQTVPLLQAVIYGQENVCYQLMLHGADMTARDLVKRNALHYAALKGHCKIMGALLQGSLREHINDTDSSCYTPLHYAAQEGHESVVDLLITSGANINAQAYCGETPLHFCITNRHQKVFDTLMRFRPQQKLDLLKNTPLRLAIRANNTAMCETLLQQQPVHETSELDRLLLEAVDAGNLAMCKLLVNQMIPKTVRHFKTHAVARAVFFGYVEIYTFLRRAGIKMRNTSEDLMMLAVQSGCVEMCQVLMEHGYKLYSDPRSLTSDALPRYVYTYSETMTLLQAATVRKRSHVAAWLVQTQGQGALRPNGSGSSALHYAARKNDTRTYSILAKYVPYTADNDGDTPLHVAVREGHLEVVQTICKHLSAKQINLANQQKHTPFSLALVANHVHVVEFLKANTRVHRIQLTAAEIMHQNITKSCLIPLASITKACMTIFALIFNNESKWFSKQTPRKEFGLCIVHAAARGLTDVVKLLLDHGVPCTATPTGETPLYEAAANGYIDTCQTLLECGIHDDGRQKHKSALLAALQYENFDVARLLLNDSHTRVDKTRGMNLLRAAIQEEAPDDIIVRIVQRSRRTLLSELRWFLRKHRQTYDNKATRLAWGQFAVRAAKLCIDLELSDASNDVCELTDDRRCPLLYSRIQFPVCGRSPHIMEAAALVVHVDRHANDPFTREPLGLHEIAEVHWLTTRKRPRT